MNHPMTCVVLIGLPCAVATGLLNEWERAFERAPLWRKAAILCTTPLALGIGVVLMAGMIGYGLMIGVSIGGNHGYPVTGAWTGACIAIMVLALEGGVFWPIYFPMTRCAND
jgi:hypothetical protein